MNIIEKIFNSDVISIVARPPFWAEPPVPITDRASLDIFLNNNDKKKNRFWADYYKLSDLEFNVALSFMNSDETDRCFALSKTGKRCNNHTYVEQIIASNKIADFLCPTHNKRKTVKFAISDYIGDGYRRLIDYELPNKEGS